MPSALETPITPLKDEKDINPLALSATHDDAPVKLGLVDDSEAHDYVHPGLEISEEENKRLRRKIHRRILPLLMLAYLCQSLDKSTIGTSVIMGWQTDVGAKGQDYALTSTLHWCGLILGEPVANQLVRRLPLGKLLGVSILIWSALLMGTAFALSIPPVFGIRVLLGFSESVVGPGLLAITVQWYLKSEQPVIGAAWQCMLGANATITSILGWGFYHIESLHAGLHGWQWLSVTISLFSFIAGGIVLMYLPDSPTKARWATEEEKVKFVERVRSNNQSLKQKVWKKEQAWEAARDPFTYCLFALAFSQTLIVGGINVFSGLLITKAFGFPVLTAQLLGIPLGFFGVAMYLLMGWLIRRTRQTLICMICFCIPNIAGTIVLLTVTPNGSNKGGLVAAFYCMQVFGGINPAIFAMLSRNSAGQTKRSITYAVTFIGWAGGNAIAAQIFQAKWAPRYLPSLEIHMGLYIVFILTCIGTRVLLARRNKRKIAALKRDDGRVVNHHALAFSDMTDLENPEFLYEL